MNATKKTKKRAIVFYTFIMITLILITLNSTIITAQVNEEGNVPLDAASFEVASAEFTEETTLSNIIVTIPADYEKVIPGGDVLASIKIMNLGGTTRIDVVLNFEIKDNQNNAIVTKKETVAIETQANLVRIFSVPKDAKEGQYSIHTTLTYADGKQVVSDASFAVVNEKKNNTFKIVIYVSIILVGLVILVFLSLKSKKWIETIRLRAQIHRIVKNKLK